MALKQYVNRETDKYNSHGTTSSTALCVLFHTLATALIEETGYQNEQFALIHPGGAVGERLNEQHARAGRHPIIPGGFAGRGRRMSRIQKGREAWNSK